MTVKAVQQFMLRKELASEKRARNTLRLMKECGYDGIELNGFMIKKVSLFVRMLTALAGMGVGNCGAFDWSRLTQEYGLKVVALHEDMGSITNSPDGVAKDAEKVGTDTVVLTGMFRYDYTKDESVRRLCERLNRAGKSMKERGLDFLYHNHNCEFVRTDGGKRPIDLILRETDPEFVGFEFDSYWAADAGADCTGIMRSMGERMKLYHINDRVSLAKGTASSILKSDGTELGMGNMNLQELVKVAKECKVRAVILENHRNFADNSAARSLQISSRFMNENV